jgi:PTH1 family peptidyl-tRNA hydrolase
MKIIIGLGNPDNKYEHSRHNAGAICVEYISKITGIKLSEQKELALIGKGYIDNETVILAKSKSYMNNSGDTVRYLCNRFGADVVDLVIIYDDMDLSLGTIRIRKGGTHGGHKGIESIINSLGTSNIPRLRVGIGRPLSEDGTINHVLGTFGKEEQLLLTETCKIVNKATLDIIKHGINQSMNNYN